MRWVERDAHSARPKTQPPRCPITDFSDACRTLPTDTKLLVVVLSDQDTPARVGSCPAVKAEPMPTAPESVCLLVGG
jgi:hypothetical protein